MANSSPGTTTVLGETPPVNYGSTGQTQAQMKKKEAELEELKNGCSPEPELYDNEFDYWLLQSNQLDVLQT